MDIVHCAEMPWGESLVAQRGATEGMAHKRLFEGDEDSPDNFMLVMSREPKTYFSPRHRHPWDQIRYCLEGKIPVAKGLFIDAGEIGYFPESAHYGPQVGGEDRIVLLLQFGGASGKGFIGPDRLKSARLAMEKVGTFEHGVFQVESSAGRSNTDAYEAVWEHEKGAPPSYASPAYKAPIIMRPVALGWKNADEPGVSRKQVGIFPHRGLAVTTWKIEAGHAFALVKREAIRFLFVNSGLGAVDGNQVRRWSAIRMDPGDEALLVAAEALELVEISVATLA